METPRSRVQPCSVADCSLDGATESPFGGAERLIKLIAVGFAQDKHINVADRALSLLAGLPGGPGPIDVCRVDVGHRPGDFGKHGRNAKSLRQHIGQPGVIRTGGVRPDEPKTGRSQRSLSHAFGV